MTPEIIARVDAWLKARPQHADLLRLWNALRCGHHLAAKPQPKAGYESALTGILLALVRDAMPDCGLVISIGDDFSHASIRWDGGDFDDGEQRDGDLAELLASALECATERSVAAMEAAPC